MWARTLGQGRLSVGVSHVLLVDGAQRSWPAWKRVKRQEKETLVGINVYSVPDL